MESWWPVDPAALTLLMTDRFVGSRLNPTYKCLRGPRRLPPSRDGEARRLIPSGSLGYANQLELVPPVYYRLGGFKTYLLSFPSLHWRVGEDARVKPETQAPRPPRGLQPRQTTPLQATVTQVSSEHAGASGGAA